MSDSKKKDLYRDTERERHLRKERKRQLREIEEDLTDEDLDQLVKKFPAPREWYKEEF